MTPTEAALTAEVERLTRERDEARAKPWMPGQSQGPCETTLAERFYNPSCGCITYAGNLGPCAKFCDEGCEGACPYCDHERECHETTAKYRVGLDNAKLQARVEVLEAEKAEALAELKNANALLGEFTQTGTELRRALESEMSKVSDLTARVEVLQEKLRLIGSGNVFAASVCADNDDWAGALDEVQNFARQSGDTKSDVAVETEVRTTAPAANPVPPAEPSDTSSDIRASERERCAKVADERAAGAEKNLELAKSRGAIVSASAYAAVASQCRAIAAAIRSLT